MAGPRDFTEAHKAACARLRAETGKSHAEIAKLAATEGLYGISFPRRPSVSTVQDWCNRQPTAESISARLYVALDALITLELPKKREDKAVSFIKQCLSAVDRAQRIDRAKQATAAKPTQEEEQAPEPEAPSLDRLREAANNAAAGQVTASAIEEAASREPAISA